MKPVDFRTHTWVEVEKRLDHSVLTAYRALQEYGPATVRELAERSGMDVLNVGPRLFDLRRCGLCRLAEVQTSKRRGTYEAVPMHAARAEWEMQRAAHRASGQQMDLRLPA